MIAGIQGILEARVGDSVIVRVGGVSFQIQVPTTTLAALGSIMGEVVNLHTHFQVREDAFHLYGFATRQELELFQTLLGVAGVGPRVALALLSALGPEELQGAIAAERADLLARVPGVGRKTASRLILELQGKLTTPPSGMGRAEGEVMAALTSLGYSTAEAEEAIRALPGVELSLEEKIRLALQELGGPSLPRES